MRHFRRSGRDEGAAAVEFALLLIPFITLCFGMITGGFVLNDKLSLNQGVREGARYGATLPIPVVSGSPDYAAFLTTIRETARGDAYGQIGTNAPTFCVGFRRASDGTEYYLTDTGTSTTSTPCTGAPALTNGTILVTGFKDTEFDLVFAQKGLTLHAISVARYEGAS